MFPIMALFKDWEACKEKYLGNIRLIVTRNAHVPSIRSSRYEQVMSV